MILKDLKRLPVFSGRPSGFISMFLVAALIIFLLSGISSPAAASTNGYWTSYVSQPVLSGTTYTITSAAELAWVAKESYEDNPFDDYTIKLSKSIDLSGHLWVPIGNDTTPFMGIFDGGSYTVSNMTIGSNVSPETGYSCQGLFAYAYDATLKNVCLANVSVFGSNVYACGGLVGSAHSSTITNCMSTGSISLSFDSTYRYEFQSGYYGGLVGEFDMGEATTSSVISNCLSSCSMTGCNDAVIGGLGGVLQGTVINCGATGSVTGGDSIKSGGGTTIGGLAAVVYGNLFNSYATGNVSCGKTTSEDNGSYAGGLVGDLGATTINCYAIGNINAGNGASTGGFAGNLSYLGATIKNSYWIGDIAYGSSDGSVFVNSSSGKTTAEMKSSAFAALLNSNKSSISSSVAPASWALDSSKNGGYPYLSGIGIFTGTPSSGPVTATPTSSSVLVNGKLVSFTAYNINGNNFFKLRDLAAALNGSAKQFNVSFDGTLNAIKITSDSAYTKVGGELTAPLGSASASATATTSAVYLDSSSIGVTAYNINGNNYFKLRDLAAAINFGVSFNSATNTIEINTSTGYSA